jgi:hypothetical protein
MFTTWSTNAPPSVRSCSHPPIQGKLQNPPSRPVKDAEAVFSMLATASLPVSTVPPGFLISTLHPRLPAWAAFFCRYAA